MLEANLVRECCSRAEALKVKQQTDEKYELTVRRKHAPSGERAADVHQAEQILCGEITIADKADDNRRKKASDRTGRRTIADESGGEHAIALRARICGDVGAIRNAPGAKRPVLQKHHR